MQYSKKKDEPAKNVCTVQGYMTNSGKSGQWITIFLTYIPLFTALILYIITTKIYNTQPDMTFNTCLITREHYIP
jgi:hypothetical protein